VNPNPNDFLPDFQAFKETSSVVHPLEIQYWLVVLTILKNMEVSWDDDIPNIWKKIGKIKNV